MSLAALVFNFHSNAMPEPATFVAEWEVEFEEMPSPKPDPRALVVASVHTEPDLSLGLDADKAEVTHPFRVTLHKAVKLVAIMVHSHHSLRRLAINHGGVNLSEGEGDNAAMQEERLRWLTEPRAIPKGDSFVALITSHFTNDGDMCGHRR